MRPDGGGDRDGGEHRTLSPPGLAPGATRHAEGLAGWATKDLGDAERLAPDRRWTGSQPLLGDPEPGCDSRESGDDHSADRWRSRAGNLGCARARRPV